MRPQMRVQPVAKPARHEMLGDVAMRHLTQRMHARIGAAGAMHAHLFAADRFDRGLQRALHRWAVLLNLPAAIGRAVIFNNELVTGHMIGSLEAVECRSIAERTGGWRIFRQRERLKMRSCINAIKPRGSLRRIAEAAIIGGVAEHKNDGLAATL